MGSSIASILINGVFLYVLGNVCVDKNNNDKSLAMFILGGVALCLNIGLTITLFWYGFDAQREAAVATEEARSSQEQIRTLQQMVDAQSQCLKIAKERLKVFETPLEASE